MTIAILVLVAMVLYTILVYPVFLYLCAILRTRNSKTLNQYQPYVSVIIPVFNAGKLIDKKVYNLLSLKYPAEKLEYIFISDGSTDDTIQRLNPYKEFKVISTQERVGKEAALRQAVRHASHEIICFTDVGTMINQNSIENLVGNLSDSSVGAVSSIDGVDEDNYFLEKLLIQYSNYVRRFESVLSTSVGVSGSLFATRKKLFESIPDNCTSDLAIALECVKQGQRVVIESGAVGYYNKSVNLNMELKRKIRTIAHGMSTIVKYKVLLNIARHGVFSWQLISHKLMRWTMPLLVFILLILLGVKIISFITLGHLLLVLPVVLLVLIKMDKFVCNALLFILYNIAIIVAFLGTITGKRWDVWEPTQRK